MAKRLTAQDYQNQYAGLLEKTVALQARIQVRAEEICRANPEVPIGHGAVGRELEKFHMSTLGYIDVIRNIERHLADQHPHKQMNLYKDV